MTPRRRKSADHLPKGVYRHGKGFRMRVYVDGKPGWQKLRAHTEAEAWIEQAAIVKPAADTIAAGIKRYVEVKVPELLRMGDLSANTWRTEARRCKALAQVFGHMRPDSVTPQHLYKFADEARDGWRKLKRFSAVWRHFLRWGLATKDPFHRFDWPKQKARTRYVRDDEITLAREVALKAAETRPSALMVWAALLMIELTGRRVTDVRRITLPQITKDVGIRFVESKTKKLTTVEWSDALGQAIDEIKARLHTDTKIRPMYLICNRDGQECSEGSLNQAAQRLRQTFKDVGIAPFQLRDIRAKYGTDHEDGRKALRHSSEAVFEKHYNRKGAVVKPLK
jgi:integrase